jgi:hypothetical protein
MERCTQLTGECADTVQVFDGRKPLRRDRVPGDVQRLVDIGLGQISRKNAVIESNASLRVPALPDCWVWVSPEFLPPAESRDPDLVRRRLNDVTADAQEGAAWLRYAVQHDLVRVITVSRARYNPRFKGRLVTEVESVKSILLQAALCLSAATPFGSFNWSAEQSPAQRPQRL